MPLNVKSLIANLSILSATETWRAPRRFFVEGVLDPGLIQTFGILADHVDEEFSLFQRGDVPPDARLLSFFGVYSTIGISVELTMNNQRLGPDYTFSGLDITSFAGQTVDLKLTFKSNEFAND
jgi:hypothetical protein